MLINVINITYFSIKMIQLDEQERNIVRALIRDPRLSDNQISRLTKVPVMSVNRKRKKLEEEGILHYYCYLDTSRYGLNVLPARQLYIITFKIGITKTLFLEKIKQEPLVKTNKLYLYESFLGEDNGQLLWCLVLEGNKGIEIMEIFNGIIVPMLRKHLGEDCITETFAVRVTTQFNLLRNYMPLVNMEKGKLKKTWDDSLIFVD